jgi:hypothetical protein
MFHRRAVPPAGELGVIAWSKFMYVFLDEFKFKLSKRRFL